VGRGEVTEKTECYEEGASLLSKVPRMQGAPRVFSMIFLNLDATVMYA
jgi:hypothetical protein